MTTNSPITDFLIQIKNSYLAHQNSVVIPSSNVKVALAEILKKYKFISDYSVTTDGAKKSITLNLTYTKHLPRLTQVQLFSTPGRRVYRHTQGLPWGKSSDSLIIISTSKGLMSQKEAVKSHLGGEVIAEIF